MTDPFYFVGQIILLPVDGAPEDFEICDGRLLPISTELIEIVSLLGTKFGGDGLRTIGLPNLPAPTGCHYFIALKGKFPAPKV